MCEATLQRREIGRRSVPGDDPALGRNRGQKLRDEIALSLEIDPIEAQSRLQESLAPAFPRSGEFSSLGARAQRIEQLTGEPVAQPVGIEIADPVGAHLEPVGDAGEATNLLAVTRRRLDQ